MAKTEHCEGYVCPYCEYLNAPAWMFSGSCGGCEREFVTWEETATTYYARDVEGGALLKSVFSTTHNEEPDNG